VLGANGATGEFHCDDFVLGLTHLDCLWIVWVSLFMLVVYLQGGQALLQFLALIK
jgi:hypothetical protein